MPSGNIIAEGETVTENGTTCTCSLDNWWDWWDFGTEGAPEASCVPMTTTPPEPIKCRLQNGSLVEGLEPETNVEVGCTIYFCDKYGRVMEAANDCGLAPTMCVDSLPGPCCRICPNGKGSKPSVYGGTHILYIHVPSNRHT